MRNHCAIARIFALVVFVALVAAATPLGPARAQEAGPAGGPQLEAATTIYLPLMVGRPGAPPPPPPPPSSGAFFITTQIKTISSVAKIDAQGRMHVVLNTFVSYNENPQAVYGFCKSLLPAECLSDAGWAFVSLADQADGIELDLTSDGRPRVLIRQRKDGTTTTDYIYGACDEACDKIENWQGRLILNASESQLFAADEPQRAFALDPQDRPRFIYTNSWGNGEPQGVFYVACEADCASAAAEWVQTPIHEGPQYRSLRFDTPALTFTANGHPRVVSTMSLSGDAQGVLYLECDADCDQQAGWSALELAETGAAASWDVAVHGEEVRVMLSGRITLNPLPDGGELEYLQCAALCTDADSWTRSALPIQGQYVDLELDAQGRPRAAYGAIGGAGLALAWCETNCQQAGNWRSRIVDPAAQLQRDFTVPHPIIDCQPSAWVQFTPSLALDPNGNPRIAYDALNVASCERDDNPNDNTPPRKWVEKLFRAVRWAVTTMP